MKVLVAGASGFIGKNLLLTSPRDWDIIATYHKSTDLPDFCCTNALNHVTSIQVDLSSKVEVNKICRFSNRYDKCIYLIANSNPAFSIAEPAFDLVSNTLPLINLLEKVSFDTFLYFSSGAVYDGLKGPVSPRIRATPKLPYGISKLSSEYYLKYFQSIGQTHTVFVVRFFGAYGPYEPSRKIYSMLVRQFGIEKNPKFTIRGNGKNLIDAMYVEDAIRAIYILLNCKGKSEIIDLYSGNPLTITQLVKYVARIFNIESKISYKKDVPEYIEFYSCDKSMLKNYGFSPTINLDDGILRLHKYLSKDRT